MRRPWSRQSDDRPADYERRRGDPLGAANTHGAHGYDRAGSNDPDREPPRGAWGEREIREVNPPPQRGARPAGAYGERAWRSDEWDEDRYGYPEATSYGREMHRARDDYGAEGRFAERDHGYVDAGGTRAAPSQRSGYGHARQARDDTGLHGAERWNRGGEPYERSRLGSSFGAREDWRRGRWQPDRGPKGYTRPDERIRDEICEALYHEPGIDVREVSVTVESGTVTIEGTVPERRMKHRIEDLCDERFGVREIDNRLRVEHVADAVRDAQRNIASRVDQDVEGSPAESPRSH